MTARLLIAAAAIALLAAWTHGNSGSPATCSNSFVFSASCNSQYAGIL